MADAASVSWKAYAESEDFRDLIRWIGQLNQGIMERPFFAGYAAALRDHGVEDE